MGSHPDRTAVNEFLKRFDPPCNLQGVTSLQSEALVRALSYQRLSEIEQFGYLSGDFLTLLRSPYQ